VRRVLAVGGSALVLALLAWAVVAARSSAAVRREARTARLAVAAGRFAEARAPLERWLRARPGAAEPHVLMARLALEEGRLGAVTEDLNRARALGYPEAGLERFHAIVLSRIGRYTEAEPILVRVLNESRGPDPEAAEALARVYLQTYRLTQAGEVIGRWIKDAPRDARPYLWLTEIDSRTVSDDASLQEAHYRAALERDPGLDKARLGLAELLRSARRGPEAAREYARYLERNPRDPAGYVGAARNALGQGDEAAAVGYLERALAIAPGDPAALKERAGIDRRRGDYAAALACLGKALEADPYDTEALYARSLVLEQLGRAEEAGAVRRRMDRVKGDQARVLAMRDQLVREPWNVDLRREIAEWMFAHGRDEEGVRWAKQVLAARPDDPAVNRLLADYHRRRGEPGLANYYRLRASSGSKAGSL
jgi:tetratricopeptide (TPR) repeat protein